MPELYSVDHGLATLGPELVEIRTLLEGQFLNWAAGIQAAPMLFPSLMRVKDLDGFDYFRNFPHLVTIASQLHSDRLTEYSKLPAVATVPGPHLADAEFVLPSAACYNIYLHLENSVLQAPRYITTVASCYRNEKEHVGLRRLWNFTMREIVCVGPQDAVQAHLASFKKKILEFTGELGLEVAIEVASDPFFQPQGSAEQPSSGARALLQKLFPTKEEFVYGGVVAIASVNFHRNFFGERCRIRTPDEKPAYTGCVAFGIERWLHALTDKFKGDTKAIAAAIRG
jgi:seryl-tRNA synthetase